MTLRALWEHQPERTADGGRVLERRHAGPGRTLASRGTTIVGPASLYWVLPPQLMLEEQEALLEETVLEMVYGRGPSH